VSEGAAEGGGAPISDVQFGDVTETGDIPPTNTAQNPGSGIWAGGWYPFGYMTQAGLRSYGPDLLSKRKARHRMPKKKRDEQ
jgi:hypothetical protein